MAVSNEVRIMEKEAQLVSQQHAKMLASIEIARMKDRKADLEKTLTDLDVAMETTRGDIEILKKGVIIN